MCISPHLLFHFPSFVSGFSLCLIWRPNLLPLACCCPPLPSCLPLSLSLALSLSFTLPYPAPCSSLVPNFEVSKLVDTVCGNNLAGSLLNSKLHLVSLSLSLSHCPLSRSVLVCVCLSLRIAHQLGYFPLLEKACISSLHGCNPTSFPPLSSSPLTSPPTFYVSNLFSDFTSVSSHLSKQIHM